MIVPDTMIDEKAEPFLQCLLSRAPEDGERRDHQRHPLSVTLLVQPLNEKLQPVGDSFRVMTRDVSAGGIGFVHAEPIERKFLKVVMPDPKRTELLVEVQHCTAVGELGLLYLIGVRLREDLQEASDPNAAVEATSVARTTMVSDPKRR